MPEFMIVGAEYTFENLEAAHYAFGVKVPVKPIITINLGGMEIVAENNTFIPQSEGKVKITYTAYYGINKVEKVYYSDAVDVNYSENIDYARYFVYDGAAGDLTDDGVRISAMEEGANFTFVNSILASDMQVRLHVSSAGNAFGKLNLYLEGTENREKIKITFEKSGNKTLLKLNDGKGYACSAVFDGNSFFTLFYDDRTQTLYAEGTEVIRVEKTADGTPFCGFAGGKVYFSAEFADVTGMSTVVVSRINNQVLGNDAVNAAPQVVFSEYDGGIKKRGDIITVEKVLISDVLDPGFEVLYCLDAPDGDAAKTPEGVPLDFDNADYGRETSFVAEQLGYYVVYIEVTDVKGNKAVYSYSVRVADDVAPVITLGDGAGECKAGETVKIKDGSAVDDVSGEVTFYVYIYSPYGTVESPVEVSDFEGLWYKPEKAGKYKVYYYAYDEAGNRAMNSYILTVK